MKDLRFKFKQWAIRNKENLPNKKHQSFLTIIECQKDILALLKEGFKIKAIYRYLCEMEKISCSYSTFRIHVNNLVKQQLNTSNLSNNMTTTNTNNKKKTKNKLQNQNIDNSSTSIKRFVHNSVPNLDELF